ncbi:hypothetical protein ACIODS_12000 [Micromonospora chalcea]|uniref:hypothetical protein n=1 Tax=Micromonospora chalcea TaxID=1874 RepID=UPI0038131EC5
MHSHHGATLIVHYNSDYSGTLTITTLPPNAMTATATIADIEQWVKEWEHVSVDMPTTLNGVDIDMADLAAFLADRDATEIARWAEHADTRNPDVRAKLRQARQTLTGKDT